MDLTKIFVLVPSTSAATVDSIKTASLASSKIYFMAKYNQIVAKGTVYGVDPSTGKELETLVSVLGGTKASDGTVTVDFSNLNYYTSEGTKTIIGAIEAIDAKVKAEMDKLATSKTLDENYEFSGQIKYVAASDGVAAHIALVDEAGTELSTINVSDIIGNGVLKTSAYDAATGILILTFAQADGTEKAIEVDLKAMLDINDISIAENSKNYLEVNLGTASVEGDTQAVFGAKIVKVAEASDSKTGLVDAKDVKDYVDSKATDLAVTAEGDTYVSASVKADVDNKHVIVATNVKDVTYTAGTHATYNGEGALATEAVAASISGVANSLVDGAQATTAIKSYVDFAVAEEALRADAKVLAGVKALDKAKASVIVNNVFFDGNKTLLDSAADDVRGCVLYGRSVQYANHRYSLYSPSDTIQWEKGNTTFDYEFIGDTGIRVKILSTTDSTPQLQSYKNNLASNFAPINKGKIFVSLGKLTFSSNVSMVLLFLVFYKGSAVTKQIQITAKSDFSKSYDITGIDFDKIRILYRFYRSASGSFAEGDEFTLDSLRIAASEDETIYMVNKCLGGSHIQIGSTSFSLPVTLRGVPNEDKWNFKYNGQKYLCDTLNLLTGKVERWVDSAIDTQTSEAITDYSIYILSLAQVSDCLVPKSISTAYPHTDIMQTPLDVSCGVSIDYTADTKSYVDIGASKDYVTPEDYGAVGDGINDDTEAIVSWLKSLTPYKVLGRKKVYKTRPIDVEITDDVTIDGNGSILMTDVSSVSPSEKSYLLTLQGSGTLRINNCSFDINARSLTGYTSLNSSCLGGISLLLFDKVYLDGCYIIDTMSGLAVSCESDIECRKCRFVMLGHVEEPLLAYPNYSFGAIGSIGNVVAKDCYFDRVGAACVTTEKSITMSGCKVVNSYNSTIECPLGRYDNVHILVDNCVFDKCMGPIFNGASQGTIHQCEQLSVSITNNVVKDYMGGSRPISNATNSNMFISHVTNAANGGSWHNASIHITGNTLSVSDHINSDEVTNTRIGIGQFIGAGDVVVQNNVIHATGNGTIISALRCIKFAGNVCKNMEDIRIENADSVNVSDNQFCDNDGVYPIIKSEKSEVSRFSIQNNTTASSSYLLYITKGCNQMILTGNVCKNLMQIVGSLTLKGVVTGNMADINLFNDASLTSQLLVTGNLPQKTMDFDKLTPQFKLKMLQYVISNWSKETGERSILADKIV